MPSVLAVSRWYFYLLLKCTLYIGSCYLLPAILFINLPDQRLKIRIIPLEHPLTTCSSSLSIRKHITSLPSLSNFLLDYNSIWNFSFSFILFFNYIYLLWVWIFIFLLFLFLFIYWNLWLCIQFSLHYIIFSPLIFIEFISVKKYYTKNFKRNNYN